MNWKKWNVILWMGICCMLFTACGKQENHTDTAANQQGVEQVQTDANQVANQPGDVQEANQDNVQGTTVNGTEGGQLELDEEDLIPEPELDIEEIDPEEVTGTIVVLTDRVDLLNSKLAEYKLEFETKYPGTEVIFEASKDYEDYASKRLEEGDYGDVLLIPESLPESEYADYFEPLGSYQSLSEYYKADYLAMVHQEGVIYGIPRYIMPQGIAYNKRVLERAGVAELPTSPEAFVEMLKKIKSSDEKIIPFYTNERFYGALAKWQKHAWGSVTADATYKYTGMLEEQEPFAKGSANYTVYKLLYDIVKEKLCEPVTERSNQKTVGQMFNNGEIGCMLVDWEELASLQQASTNPDDVGYMPFPYTVLVENEDGEMEEQQFATAELSYSYAVNKNSENKMAARAWVEYILRHSGFAVSEGADPIRKKTEFPTILDNFKGIHFIVVDDSDEEAVERYNATCEKAKLWLEEDSQGHEVRRIVKAAMQENGESFEDIMKDWNDRWKAARK